MTGRELDVPYLLAADDTFRMQKHILKPYPGRNLSAGQRIFNYRLSRARRVAENAFGIMTKIFQILYRPIQLNERKTTLVTLACCALHHFIIHKNSNYMEGFSMDRYDEQGKLVPGDCTQDLLQISQQRTEECPTTYISNEVKEIRQEIEQYFMSAAGEIPFQYKSLC